MEAETRERVRLYTHLNALSDVPGSLFVATGGSGKQMYGTCLTLWEPYVITAKTKKGAVEGKKKEVYLPKCLVLLSTYQYLTAFREFLMQLNRLSKMGEMTLPVERHICNFCAEIPAPAPGAFEVQTTILDSVIEDLGSAS
jgi:hypothetical protein